MTDSLSIAAHAFASRVLISVSVDETLLHRKVDMSTGFRELPFCVGWLKHTYFFDLGLGKALSYLPNPSSRAHDTRLIFSGV